MRLIYWLWKLRGGKLDVGTVEACALACEKLAAEYAAEKGSVKVRAAIACAERIRGLLK